MFVLWRCFYAGNHDERFLLREEIIMKETRNHQYAGRIVLSLAIAAAALSLAGCSSKASTETQTPAAPAAQAPAPAAQAPAPAAEAPAPAEVRKVYVGVGATFEPYTYIDENGKPAGYDVAVLEAVDELLPQYEFEIENMELANILVALDAKRVSIGSQQFETNPERRQKYLFTNEGFANYNKRIVFKRGRTDIHTTADLAGKKVAASQGSNTAAILEKYNEEHPDNPIEVVYTNGATAESQYDDVQNGRLDAIVATRKTYNRYNDSFGGGYEINEDELFSESQAYFLLAQGEEELRDAVDGALKELKESGKLTELSVEYTGSDYDSET